MPNPEKKSVREILRILANELEQLRMQRHTRADEDCAINHALSALKQSVVGLSVPELEKMMGEIVNKGLDDGKDTATIIREQAEAIYSAQQAVNEKVWE